MTTTYIRFPDESTGMAALDAAGFLDADGNPLTASHTHALDCVGLIYQGGTFDPDTGELITPPVLLRGWHCNYIGELPEEWDAYVVTPVQPVRVFAA
jgi:hypothetical protein